MYMICELMPSKTKTAHERVETAPSLCIKFRWQEENRKNNRDEHDSFQRLEKNRVFARVSSSVPLQQQQQQPQCPLCRSALPAASPISGAEPHLALHRSAIHSEFGDHSANDLGRERRLFYCFITRSHVSHHHRHHYQQRVICSFRFSYLTVASVWQNNKPLCNRSTCSLTERSCAFTRAGSSGQLCQLNTPIDASTASTHPFAAVALFRSDAGSDTAQRRGQLSSACRRRLL